MMAESDKKRFDTEVEHIQQFCIHILIHVLQIAAYNTQSQSASTLKGKALKKKVKDPNAPKRSLSAFFFFGNDQRAQIKEENPDFGVTDIAKEIGKRWADIDPNLKAKFEKLAEDDKARYSYTSILYKINNATSHHQICKGES